jgi:hypothetical protein
MPLNTQIMRDGEAVKLSWCDFHVAAMLYAIAFERRLDGTGPNANLDYPTEPQGLSPRNIFDVTNYPTIGYVCPQGPLRSGERTPLPGRCGRRGSAPDAGRRTHILPQPEG